MIFATSYFQKFIKTAVKLILTWQDNSVSRSKSFNSRVSDNRPWATRKYFNALVRRRENKRGKEEDVATKKKKEIEKEKMNRNIGKDREIEISEFCIFPRWIYTVSTLKSCYFRA